jgi:hypothetical protein
MGGAVMVVVTPLRGVASRVSVSVRMTVQHELASSTGRSAASLAQHLSSAGQHASDLK